MLMRTTEARVMARNSNCQSSVLMMASAEVKPNNTMMRIRLTSSRG